MGATMTFVDFILHTCAVALGIGIYDAIRILIDQIMEELRK